MRIAHIVPTAYQEHLRGHGFGGTIMAMAQLALSSSDYLNQMRAARQEGSILLLDNGTPYLGQAVPDEVIVAAAQLLDPDVVVLPDVLHDPQATQSRTNTFLNRYADAMQCEFMGVIQGTVVAEYAKSYTCLICDSRISHIGVPYMRVSSGASGVVFERERVFEELRARGLLDEARPHHLLGLSHSGHIELRQLRRFPTIVCCDTSAAYKTAVAGHRLCDSVQQYQKPDIAMDFGAPLDQRTAALLVQNATCMEQLARSSERNIDTGSTHEVHDTETNPGDGKQQ